MFEFELLNCLFIPTTSGRAKGSEIISEQSYFSRDTDLLMSYPCRNCGSHSLFKGFFFIQCKECIFEFMDESELTEVIIKAHSLGSG